MSDYWFNNVDHALSWSTEVLRQRRYPNISGFYREIVSGNVVPFKKENDAQLPTDQDDRMALALKVKHACEQLPLEDQQLIKLKYWGDYADDKRLNLAKAVQDYARQKGKRVRLSYTYSLRQVGSSLGCDHKTVSRRLDKILPMIEQLLHEDCLLCESQKIAV